MRSPLEGCRRGLAPDHGLRPRHRGRDRCCFGCARICHQTIPAAMPTARASAYRALSRSLSTISVRGSHNRATAGIRTAQPDRSPLVARRKRPRNHPGRVMARIVTPASCADNRPRSPCSERATKDGNSRALTAIGGHSRRGRADPLTGNDQAICLVAGGGLGRDRTADLPLFRVTVGSSRIVPSEGQEDPACSCAGTGLGTPSPVPD